MIIHPDNPVETLSQRQVIDIFMGREVRFPNGATAIPVDQAPNSPVRERYYQQLIGKSIAQINAYWARLLFTGRATPPRVLGSNEAVMDTVLNNRDVIAYIDRADLTDQVKIIYTLQDAP
ncbi:MAG: hypothetical protein C0620_09165 [Desulfuromonas sp.]|nr:MAG: hypothetical protein C0620_09165 [Desulfuromonas sp.]